MSERRRARGLVDRLGGAARVRDLLDAFYARLFDDPMVGFFFAGHDRASIVDGQLDFLMWAFGAVDERRGRHPREAHTALAPILRGHFDRRIVVLREVLGDAGVDPADIDAWVRVEESMRKHVQAPAGVRPPTP